MRRFSISRFARSAAESAYPQLWRGCIGAWAPCLGPSGVTLRDWSGRANNGTLTNAGFGLSGGGWSLECNGTSGYASIADSAILDVTTVFSVSFWLKRNGSTGNFQVAVGKTTGGSSGGGFGFYVDNSATNVLDFQVYTGTDKYLGRNGIALADGFNHAVGICDTSQSGDERVHIYLNGSLQSGSVVKFGTFAGAGANALPLAFGARSSDMLRFFNGNLDDLRIYSRVLTASEIALLYSGGYGRGIAYTPRPIRHLSRVAADLNRRRRFLMSCAS